MKWGLLLSLVLFIAVPALAQQQWCGVQNLYFQDVPSGIDGFQQLANYASGNPLIDENITIDSSMGIVPIDTYISESGALDGVMLLSGLRQYNIYGYVSSVASPSYFTINVSAYNTVTGVEHFFYNITSVQISSVTPKLDQTFYVSPTSIAFAPTERLLIRIGAYTERNAATTIHFLNQGNTPTYIVSGYFECPILATPPGSRVDEGPAFLVVCGALGGILGALVLIRRKQ